MQTTLEQIADFYQVAKRIATSGQPQAEQFELIHKAGFEVVINLALRDSPKAVINEASLVKQWQMEYLPILVDFNAPELEQLEVFFDAMQRHRRQKIFIHCVMNWRVSAFYVSLSPNQMSHSAKGSSVT